jgi:hypothetical protein
VRPQPGLPVNHHETDAFVVLTPKSARVSRRSQVPGLVPRQVQLPEMEASFGEEDSALSEPVVPTTKEPALAVGGLLEDLRRRTVRRSPFGGGGWPRPASQAPRGAPKAPR